MIIQYLDPRALPINFSAGALPSDGCVADCLAT